MKKVGFILVVIVLLIIINGLLHSIFDLWQKQDLLTTANHELEAEKLKNSKLKADLSYASSQQFVDETARNKLFLAKPGEQEILISKDIVNKNSAMPEASKIPNWQKWINLFF